MVTFTVYLYIRMDVETDLGICELSIRKGRTNLNMEYRPVTPTTEQLKFVLTYSLPFFIYFVNTSFHSHCFYYFGCIDSLVIFHYSDVILKIIFTYFPLSACPWETSILSVTRRCWYYYRG